MRLRKGDQVEVIAGNDNGRRGEVLDVDRKNGRVLVEGVNMRWKHRKPTQESPKGERVQQAQSIHVSNVMLVDPRTGERTRKRPPAEGAAKQG